MSESFRKIGDWTVIDITQEINYEISLNLKQDIENLCDQGEVKIAINLAGVSFIGSLSLGIFSFGKKLLSDEGGDICILRPNATVKEALSTTQLERIVQVVDDEEELKNL